MSSDGGTGQSVFSKAGGYDLLKLQEKYRQFRGIRSRFEPSWYLNGAFFEGNQWLRWTRQGRLDRPRLADWRRTPALQTGEPFAPVAESEPAPVVES